MLWLPPTICFRGFALSINPLSSLAWLEKNMAFTHFTVSLRTFIIVVGATRHLLPWFCFELQPSLIWVGASRWKIIVSFTPSLFHCVTFHCFTVDIRTSLWGPLNICFRGFALIFNPLSFERENIRSLKKCDNHKYHCFFF